MEIWNLEGLKNTDFAGQTPKLLKTFEVYNKRV